MGHDGEGDRAGKRSPARRKRRGQPTTITQRSHRLRIVPGRMERAGGSLAADRPIRLATMRIDIDVEWLPPARPGKPCSKLQGDLIALGIMLAGVAIAAWR